ncbi:MAG: WGR domain-containing protein [Ardenticatenales bacterium]|nr:WGR domain-containing protein [Ardenticatenales bacterium]
MHNVAEVDWKTPLPTFQCVLLDREDATQNPHRFYEIRWQATLLDDGAVVRTWGRKGSVGALERWSVRTNGRFSLDALFHALFSLRLDESGVGWPLPLLQRFIAPTLQRLGGRLAPDPVAGEATPATWLSRC